MAENLAPVEQSDMIHWQLRAGVEETMCGLDIAVEAARVTLLPDKATCAACEAALWGYQCGRADERTAAAPSATTQDEISIEAAAQAVYRKYGNNLAAFWRDAFAAEAQSHGDDAERYNVDGNCIHFIPICRQCQVNTINAHLKEKAQIHSAPAKSVDHSALRSELDDLRKRLNQFYEGYERSVVVSDIRRLLEICDLLLSPPSIAGSVAAYSDTL